MVYLQTGYVPPFKLYSLFSRTPTSKSKGKAVCPRLQTLIFWNLSKAITDDLSPLLILNHGKSFLLACGNKNLLHWWLLPNISNLKISNKTRVYFQQSNFDKKNTSVKFKKRHNGEKPLLTLQSERRNKGKQPWECKSKAAAQKPQAYEVPKAECCHEGEQQTCRPRTHTHQFED